MSAAGSLAEFWICRPQWVTRFAAIAFDCWMCVCVVWMPQHEKWNEMKWNIVQSRPAVQYSLVHVTRSNPSGCCCGTWTWIDWRLRNGTRKRTQIVQADESIRLTAWTGTANNAFERHNRRRPNITWPRPKQIMIVFKIADTILSKIRNTSCWLS